MPETDQSNIPPCSSDNTDNKVDNAITIVNEHWMKAFWLPTMAWVWMFICLMDFTVFPFFNMMIPFVCNILKIAEPFTYTPWVPITMSNGGFIHISFAGVLGISKYPFRKRDDQ